MAATATTVKQAWQEFCRRVLAHQKLSAEQLRIMRDLFYDGALVGFTLAIELDDLPDMEALKRLEVIRNEFRAHCKELRAQACGHAGPACPECGSPTMTGCACG